MDSRQKRIIFGSIMLVLALWIVLPLALSKREPDLPLSKVPLVFDAARAFQTAREFVTQFPTRVFGSLEARQSTGYLHEALSQLGYQIEYSHFDGRIGKRKQVGRNILAYKQGETPEILAIAAPLDTARPTVQGAMKNGAAVSVLLELARIYSQEKPHHSLLFILSDGGEWGSMGARDLSASYPGRKRIAAVLSLDHVAIGDTAGFRLDATGQLGGFAPPWLRTLAQKAAESQGLAVASPSNFKELMERALLISGSDQGPFLKAEIPAINLAGVSTDPALEKSVLHSSQDTIEKIKVSSIGKYGYAAERLVRSLDQLPSIPKESSQGLRVWDSRFIGLRIIEFLQALSFLPLLLIFYFGIKNAGKKLNAIQIGRELLAVSVTYVPFLVLYLGIRLAYALRLFPFYDLYPAIAKDPVMMNPPWKVLGIIGGATFLIALAAYVICKYALTGWPKPEYAASRLVLLGLTLVAAILALFYNPFWALVFLVAPAWIWALIGSNATSKGKIRNAALILVAGIPYGIIIWLLASHMGMGWNFVWYNVLALTTGLFSHAAYFLGLFIVAIGIRFIAIQKHS